MSAPDPAGGSRGGNAVWWLLGGLLLIAIALGATGYVRFVDSEKLIGAELTRIEQLGASLDVPGCVDESMNFHARCEAMKSLCDSSVYRAMQACLQAGERGEYCEDHRDALASTSFGYEDCARRDLARAGKKACAAAYRAVDAHCRSYVGAAEAPQWANRRGR